MKRRTDRTVRFALNDGTFRMLAPTGGDFDSWENAELAKRATGVFLTGGDQRRLAETLEGSEVLGLVRELHRAGAVVLGMAVEDFHRAEAHVLGHQCVQQSVSGKSSALRSPQVEDDY